MSGGRACEEAWRRFLASIPRRPWTTEIRAGIQERIPNILVGRFEKFIAENAIFFRLPTRPKRNAFFAWAALSMALVGLFPSMAYAEKIQLQYDANGNVTSQTTHVGTTTYVPDVVNRVISESGLIKTQTFVYDNNGNRIQDGGGTLIYIPNGNVLSTRYGTSNSRDPAGNITGDGTYTYTYNQPGQVYQVWQGGGPIATYYYDYRNRRTRKVISGGQRRSICTIGLTT